MCLAEMRRRAEARITTVLFIAGAWLFVIACTFAFVQGAHARSRSKRVYPVTALPRLRAINSATPRSFTVSR